MRRRDFLAGSMLAAATAAAGRTPDRAKLDRLSVMTLSFNKVLKSASHPDDPERTLDILDAPQMLVDRFGIHHVELQHTHFASTESSYLQEFHGRLKQAKSQMNQICLEFGPLNISSPDPILRLETIDLTKQWIDHAAELGCPRVMLNQGTLAPDVRQTAIATVKTIASYGKSKKVFVTLENRGRALSPTNARLGGSRGSDQGGRFMRIPTPATSLTKKPAHAGLRAMYPLSSGSSHAHYDPDRYSEANAIAISKELGYKGLYSIEATPTNGPDPYIALQTIIDEMLKDI